MIAAWPPRNRQRLCHLRASRRPSCNMRRQSRPQHSIQRQVRSASCSAGRNAAARQLSLRVVRRCGTCRRRAKTSIGTATAAAAAAGLSFLPSSGRCSRRQPSGTCRRAGSPRRRGTSRHFPRRRFSARRDEERCCAIGRRVLLRFKLRFKPLTMFTSWFTGVWQGRGKASASANPSCAADGLAAASSTISCCRPVAVAFHAACNAVVPHTSA